MRLIEVAKMPNQERTFEVGGKTYTVRFTQNALYRLMREVRATPGAFERGVGLVEIQLLLWAGLEGGRLKYRSRSEPYTMDEAGDLIDALGGFEVAAPIVSAALAAVSLPGANGADPS